MLIWSLSHYYELKDEDYRIDFSGYNDGGCIDYYYCNNKQAQLWVDGCNFYRYPRPTSYETFWEFESIYFIQCYLFVTKFSRDEYEHEVIE